MSFSESDYQAAAQRLGAPVAHVKAIADVESAGETFWTSTASSCRRCASRHTGSAS